jgi:hypothetical protein
LIFTGAAHGCINEEPAAQRKERHDAERAKYFAERRHPKLFPKARSRKHQTEKRGECHASREGSKEQLSPIEKRSTGGDMRARCGSIAVARLAQLGEGMHCTRRHLEHDRSAHRDESPPGHVDDAGTKSEVARRFHFEPSGFILLIE